jgi:hypothetical protein
VPRILLERYEIEMTINGETVDWTDVVLEEFSLHESTKQRYPTAELTFACGPHWVLENPFLDASPVVITLTDLQMIPPSPPQTYKMRAFNFKFRPITNYFKWYVSLQIDSHDLHTAKIKSYGNVTSSDAIAACAVDGGLEPDCDPSADAQVWLRTNDRGAEFIYKTARHSWASATSCFVTAILATHKLRHYNLETRVGQAPEWTFLNVLEEKYAPAENEILFEDAVYMVTSGTTNAYVGYGRTNSSYDILTGFEFPLAGIASVLSGAINMDAGFRGSQRAVTMPYDSENTHENYGLALSQNQGIKALFSSRVELTTRFGRHAELLDYVLLLPYAMGLREVTDGLIVPWDGLYFVSEIHTLVTPAIVGKKYVLLKEGMEVSGTGAGGAEGAGVPGASPP